MDDVHVDKMNKIGFNFIFNKSIQNDLHDQFTETIFVYQIRKNVIKYNNPNKNNCILPLKII